LRQAYDYWQNQPDNKLAGRPWRQERILNTRTAQHPRGGESLLNRKGCIKHPAAAASPAYQGDADDHPIAPTKPLRTSPHAGVPTEAPLRALVGCGIWPSGGGAGPRGQRRRTADPTGRLPPGI